MIIVSLTYTSDIPLSSVDRDSSIENIQKAASLARSTEGEPVPVICVCRLGNDSQLAVKRLKSRLHGEGFDVKDIMGGLNAWSTQIDPEFPTY